MDIVLFSLISGIGIGYLLKKRKKILEYIEKIIFVNIILLLFILGLNTGANKEITSNMGAIGLQAILIAATSIIGSVFVLMFVYKYFFKNKIKKDA